MDSGFMSSNLLTHKSSLVSKHRSITEGPKAMNLQAPPLHHHHKLQKTMDLLHCELENVYT